VFGRNQNNVHIVIDTVSATGTGTHWHANNTDTAQVKYCNLPMHSSDVFPIHARIAEAQNPRKQNEAAKQCRDTIHKYALTTAVALALGAATQRNAAGFDDRSRENIHPSYRRREKACPMPIRPFLSHKYTTREGTSVT
jgi:hypothetical protein